MLASSFTKISPPSILFSQHHIYASNPHPFAPQKSSCQSLRRTMIHTAHEKYSLSTRDCAPSQKPTHEDAFAITCKTTIQTKYRNKSETIFLAPLNHRATHSSAIDLN